VLQLFYVYFIIVLLRNKDNVYEKETSDNRNNFDIYNWSWNNELSSC
jgi:hypothetical protein